MQFIELYFQCFTLTSFLFAIVILFLFSISKYSKKLGNYDRKNIQETHQSLETTTNHQSMLEIESDNTNIEISRCLNTTKASTIGLYDYNIFNEILPDDRTQYFDITCCNQESLPCHRHGNPPLEKCVINETQENTNY